MLKRRISRELAQIYSCLIYPEMLDERAGRIFPDLICAREFTCDHREITTESCAMRNAGRRYGFVSMREKPMYRYMENIFS